MENEHPSSRPTILVAEDEEGIRNLVRRALEKEYDLLIAADGAQALELAQSFSGTIHLLLTDVQMPGMLGTDLAHELRQQRPALKVVLMSGFTGGFLILDQGWEFIHKPFILHALRRRIAELLREPQPQAVQRTDEGFSAY
jgi:two-component system cell cycle sensor histidine kinase/response regulator CckA